MSYSPRSKSPTYEPHHLNLNSPLSVPPTSPSRSHQNADTAQHINVSTCSIDFLTLLIIELGNTESVMNKITLLYNKYTKIIHHPHQTTDLGGKVRLPYIPSVPVRIYHIYILTHRGRGKTLSIECIYL